MEVKIDEKAGKIIIELPISPRPSASGKTQIVASTAGNQASLAVYQGKPVIVGCNCYIKK